jgi:hypothetical protein
MRARAVAVALAAALAPGRAPDAAGSIAGIPADRVTEWNPGIPGGIPARTRVCETVPASRFGDGAADAAQAIQRAIDACPVGQVVR